MADNAAATIASTLQSASLNRAPSPTHDINPSTSASTKIPVIPHSPSSSSPTTPTSPSISISALKPAPRRPRPNLPPLPDLRFEQSYLASLKETKTSWDVAWVTARDQVFMPLLQGTIWTLMLSGWRFWNRGVMMKGEGVGARVRRWWWGVNNWTLPEEARGGSKGSGGHKLAEDVRDVSSVAVGIGGGVVERMRWLLSGKTRG